MQGYPIATIAWYGPEANRATKVVVGIQRRARGEIAAMEKWFRTRRTFARTPPLVPPF
jgi:hypothetical protein